MKQVALSLIFVGISLFISRKQLLRLEKEILFGSARVFLQLVALGYVLNYVFAVSSVQAIVGLLSVMVAFGAWTCARSASNINQAFLIALVGLGAATLACVGAVVAFGIVKAQPRTIIPIAGIAIGVGAKVATLAFGRVRDEVAARKAQIEAALCLGATGSQAIQEHLKLCLRRILAPTLVSLRLVGIVHLPGAMAGMIIGGADVFDAVWVQVIIFYMILAEATIAGTIVSHLTARQFFSRDHRLLAPA